MYRFPQRCHTVKCDARDDSIVFESLPAMQAVPRSYLQIHCRLKIRVFRYC